MACCDPTGLTRRQALTLMSVAGVGLATVRPLRALERLGSTAPGMASPRGVARNVLLVFLEGGPSHVDTFDLKEGAWSPSYLGGVDTHTPIGRWPAGLMPRLAERLERLCVLRSLAHREQVHERASFMTESGHVVNPALAPETPHVGAVIASELDAERSGDSSLPTFVALGGTQVGTGFLPADLAPFDPSAGYGAAPYEHPFGEARFASRRELLRALDPDLGEGTRHAGFVERAMTLMSDPQVRQLLEPGPAELERYGDTAPGRSLAVAARLLRSGLGARVVQATLGGWDQHQQIYDGGDEPSLRDLAGNLDRALAALLDDLAAAEGMTTASLLDETLVVVRGEFGRTPGALNDQGGRDHHAYAFAGLVAGAGVVGSRALGATDPTGAWITEPGWGRGRPMQPQDLAATVYSALGIDWTTVVEDTPSRRPFTYVENDPALSPFTEVAELWGETTPGA